MTKARLLGLLLSLFRKSNRTEKLGHHPIPVSGGRRSESLWFGTDQYCLEDEGVVPEVCDEEDGEGLIHSCYLYMKKQGASHLTRSTLFSFRWPSSRNLNIKVFRTKGGSNEV